MTEVINSFRGEYAFLSNMYSAPITVKLMGLTLDMPSSEHVFQSMKALTTVA